jgi:aryl-alcohol dehydrogenase-like predicted oxidoreductase
VLSGIGGQHGKSPGEAAIAWTLRLPSAAIVGARKPGQISQLISAASRQLSPAEVNEIQHFLAENPG